MGKIKKKNLLNKNVPLNEQITGSKVKRPKNKVKVRLHAEEGPILDEKTSQKILKEAKKQQLEFSNDGDVRKSTALPLVLSDDEEFDNKEEVYVEDFADDIQVNEEDENEFELFKNAKGEKCKNLADIIMEKIQEKQNELNERFSDVGSMKLDDIDPRVKEMYEGIRDVMKRYRSGKVPKAFKIIPKLRNWEQILYLTDPAGWSAAAMYQGTRIFCSVLSQNMAQRFYNLVLLPRVRDDLGEYKRLNVHLYKALKKALFKPAAFMKGIILPLLQSGDATLREAIIFGSVIARNSIPVLHSSACLLKICEMEYTGANSIFIRILLDKRYVLPYRVVDAAVFHFLRFEYDKRQMPVLWHQSFLTFVQRYKNDISTEQKEALLGLLKKQSHPKITPEIRRELQAASCREIEMAEPMEKIAKPEKMFDDIDMEYSADPSTT